MSPGLQGLQKLLRVRTGASGAQVPVRTSLFAVLPVLLTLSLCALSATAWAGIFPSSALFVPALVSLATASIVSWLARRQSVVICLAVVVGAVFVTAHLTALRSLSTGGTAIPSSRSLRAFVDAFRNGWSRMLTSPIPMNFDVDRSLVFVIVVVMGTSAGMYFAVRQRALPAAMVGPSVIAISARLYGANTRAPWPALAAAIGASTAILAALSANSRLATRASGQHGFLQGLVRKAGGSTQQITKQNPGQPAGHGLSYRQRESLPTNNRAPLGFRGKALTAVALTALLGATIAGIGLAANKKRVGKPYDPRHVAPLQNDDALAIDPLSYVPYWAQNGKQKMFTVSPRVKNSDVALPTRWRIAVLDNFDGARWLPNTRYTETGTLLPSPPSGTGLDKTAPAISVEVTIADLPERWLPVPGWPTELTGTAIALDQEHGVVLQRAPNTSFSDSRSTGQADGQTATDQPDGELPKTRYRVKANPLFTQAPANLGNFATSQEARESLATPKIPADLTNIAQTIASSASTPQERVALIETYLRSFYQFNSAAQPGHSYARIERLLRDQGTQGEGGTSEQFAVAFAILARSLGIPTRVVVGFVVDPNDTGSPETEPATTEALDGTNSPDNINSIEIEDTQAVTVTARQARAWPEVLFADAGWVPFDPTPKAGSTAREPKPDPAGANDATTTTVPDTVPSTVAEEIEPTVAVSKAFKLSPWVWVFLFVVLGVLLVLGLTSLVVRNRSAKRRLQTGRLAIFGAWQEATRSLAACDQTINRGDTLNEYTQRTVSAERFRSLTDPLTTMAFACEKSQFSSTEPTAAEIASAWAASDQVLQGVRAAATPKEKAILLFDPRR
jgi:transglutaminase-like putative cysteine protease